MENQLVKQVMVVNKDASDSNRVFEKISLFDSDGAAIDLANLGGGGSSLEPGIFFEVNCMVVATTATSGVFDITDPEIGSEDWETGGTLTVPAGFYNVSFSPSGGITGPLTDSWTVALHNEDDVRNIVTAKADTHGGAWRMGHEQIIYIPEPDTELSVIWSRQGTTSANFTCMFKLQSFGFALV